MPAGSRSRSRTTSPSSHTTLPRLKRRELNIPASRVRKTWRPLPQQSQDRIRTLLLSIQSQTLAIQTTTSSRSGLPTQWKGNQHHGPRSSSATTTAQSDRNEAILSLFSKLTRSIPKMTFPASSSSSSSRKRTRPSASTTSSTGPTTTAIHNNANETDLSLDATLQRTTSLTSQLTTTTQSSKLLRAQIRAEEDDLRRDREELRTLEENSKRAVQANRDRTGGKGAHYLSVEPERKNDLDDKDNDDDDDGDEYDDYKGMEAGLRSSATTNTATATATARQPYHRHRHRSSTATAYAKDEDEDLMTLKTNLKSHLASMRTNTACLETLRRELSVAEMHVRRFASVGYS